MTGHLLVLEGLARILAAAGRTDRTVRDRHAVRGAKTAEVPALHTAREALTDRGARDVHELTRDEVIGGDFGADGDDCILGDAEFRDLALRLDLGDGEPSTLCLRNVLDLGLADADLQRRVAVLVLRPMGDHLTLVDLQDRDRDVFTRIRKDACHPQLSVQ